MKRSDKKALEIFFLLCIGMLVPMIAIIVWMDPFFQYHKPLPGQALILRDAVYQTPGAARNLEYTDVIVGSSMTENFHASWFDQEMGWHTVKLSYSGARTNDLRAILEQVFAGDRKVNHVLMDLNGYQFLVPAWTSYTTLPAYLYDDSVWNDASYLLNRDSLQYSISNFVGYLLGKKDNIDSAYCWDENTAFGEEIAKKDWATRRAQLLSQPGEQLPPGTLPDTFQENLDNLTPIIRAHPDTKFIFYLPPYSMLYWEEALYSERGLENFIGIYENLAKELLEYPNVTFYYYQYEPEIITNLDNYLDSCHHTPQINRYLFEQIKAGEKELTKENYQEAFQQMYRFAKDYDYSRYWK